MTGTVIETVFAEIVTDVSPRKGDKGDQGDAGPPGDPGDPGPKGDQGDPGTPGGPAGESAYQTAVDAGFVGTEEEWLASLAGTPGPPGADGADGADGPPGAQGDPGAAGADGTDGAPGAPGADATAIYGLPVTLDKGGTGAITAPDARTSLFVYSKTEVDTAVAALIASSEIGVANGIATLDGTTHIPDAQIPSGIARAAALLFPTGLQVNSRKTWIESQNAKPVNPARDMLALAATRPFKILFGPGDSITEGNGVTTIGQRWINLVKDGLCSSIGLPSGSDGSYPAMYSPLGPTWGPVQSAGTLGSDGLGKRSWKSPAGSSATDTLVATCNALQIFYNLSSSYGAFTITIDGSVVATVDCHQVAAGPTPAVWDSVVAGVPITSGAHTIVLTTLHGTVATFAVNIATIMPFLGNYSSGIQLYEGGFAGLPSWIPTGAELAEIALIAPDLVVIPYGVNDSAFSITPATTASNFASTVTAIRAVVPNAVFVFVSMWGHGDVSEATWIPYHDAIFNQAIVSGAAFSDMYETLGWQGTADLLTGADHVHPNPAASVAFADTFIRSLGVAPPGSTGNFLKQFPGVGEIRAENFGGTPSINVRFAGDTGARLALGQFGANSAIIWGDGKGGGLGLLSDNLSILSLSGRMFQARLIGASPVTVTADHTLALSDLGAAIHLNSTSSHVLTIPLHASVPSPVGATFDVVTDSTGFFSVVCPGGTLEVPSDYSATLVLPNAVATWRQRATDVWELVSSSDLSGFGIQLAGLYAPLFAVTGVKTAATYTATTGQFVPVDTTSNSVTVTLPAATVGATVGVKHVIQGGTNIVTYQCAGSDVINKAGGSTSGTLSLVGQAVLLQAVAGVWYVTSTDVPLAQLDLRYAPLASPTFTGTLTAAALALTGAFTSSGSQSTFTSTGAHQTGQVQINVNNISTLPLTSLGIYKTAGDANPTVSLSDANGTGAINFGAGAANATDSAITRSGASGSAILTVSGTLAIGTGLSITDAKNIVFGTTTGTKIGTATAQKIGFWNATPIIQPASASQAAVGTTAPAGGTGTAAGGWDTSAHRDTAITTINACVTLVNQIRSDLVSAGILKGSA